MYSLPPAPTQRHDCIISASIHDGSAPAGMSACLNRCHRRNPFRRNDPPRHRRLDPSYKVKLGRRGVGWVKRAHAMLPDYAPNAPLDGRTSCTVARPRRPNITTVSLRHPPKMGRHRRECPRVRIDAIAAVHHGAMFHRIITGLTRCLLERQSFSGCCGSQCSP
jgi:hypothetical protein